MVTIVKNMIRASGNYRNKELFSGLFYFVFIKPVAFLNRYPVMLKTKSFHLVYFGVFAALGVMASLSVFFYYLYVRGFFSHLSVFPVALCFVLGDLIGVKLFYFISLGKSFFLRPWIYLNETTMYNQGGLFGLMIAGITVALIENIDLLVMFDAMIMACSLGLFLGRLGCYNYGCCFGVPTGNSVHVAYHRDYSKIIRTNPELKGVPLVPTQIITAYFDLLMFVLFALTASIYPADGLVTLMFIFLFNGFRISIQKYRFTEQSDLMNFSRTAILFLFSGLLFWAFLFGLIGFKFVSWPLQVPWTITGWAEFVFETPGVVMAIVIAGVIAFLFYGIHGRRLGTHLNTSD
jgi:prolipoprotein diacylglyceryltransferase